jgi:hypothetical protein
MKIFSFNCNSNRLLVIRLRIWEYLNGIPEDFLLLIVKCHKINRFIEVIYYRVKSVKYEEY